MTTATVTHPARFPAEILGYLADELRREAAPAAGGLTVLDPFAGTGGIHLLEEMAPVVTFGVEIEHEWARLHPRTVHGDSRHLVLDIFDPASFDVVATSPAYGNRMADAYDGRDGSRRHTYRLSLGRPLSPGNGAAMQWGPAYRHLHLDVWRQVWAVLKPGGLFLLNVKNHVRGGREQHVVEWHAGAITALGFLVEHVEVIATGGIRDGANSELRTDGERVISFRKPRRVEPCR